MDLLSGLDFKIFGIGVVVFILLVVWLRILYREKEAIQNQLKEVIENILNSKGEDIKVLTELNTVIKQINDEIKNSNSANAQSFQDSNNNYNEKNQSTMQTLADIKTTLEIIKIKLDNKNNNNN